MPTPAEPRGLAAAKVDAHRGTDESSAAVTHDTTGVVVVPLRAGRVTTQRHAARRRPTPRHRAPSPTRTDTRTPAARLASCMPAMRLQHQQQPVDHPDSQPRWPSRSFPRGTKGLGKPFSDRYKLQRFGRGGFASAALRAQAPIVPCSIMGSKRSIRCWPTSSHWPGCWGCRTSR